MTALFLVLIVSLVVAGLFLGGFIWSVRKDQFEDQQGCAMRMLYDDEPVIINHDLKISQPNTNKK